MSKVSAFARAARELEVPEQELREWMEQHVRPRVSPSMWSHWEHGRKPISERHLYRFLRARKRGDQK